MHKITYIICILLSFFVCLLEGSINVYALVQSSHYQFLDYSFGSGGDTNDSTHDLLGELSGLGSTQSNDSTHSLNKGLTYSIEAFVPPAPTVTDPGGSTILSGPGCRYGS